ncbi:hypothetical protein AKO1_013484 [Acrasis kona]|uniref:LysM domain-containing protein n=1 Tax=Acrasis kona TaxID=1008807 RepID=A0AAW2YL91_9EUKA
MKITHTAAFVLLLAVALCKGCTEKHVIKHGDFCHTIASDNRISVSKLVALNKNLDCEKLKVGEELSVGAPNLDTDSLKNVGSLISNNDTKIIASYYCSLTDPVHLGYCGNPAADWVAACGISVAKPPCEGCGITAFNPAAYNQDKTRHNCQWQGKSCGQCWKISGAGGSKKVMVTDCCAGYPGTCSCLDCPTVPLCDWCATGDHLHFDLDIDSFNTVCGPSGVQRGHCDINEAIRIPC